MTDNKIVPSAASDALIAEILTKTEITMEDAIRVRDAFIADGGTNVPSDEDCLLMLRASIMRYRLATTWLSGLQEDG